MELLKDFYLYVQQMLHVEEYYLRIILVLWNTQVMEILLEVLLV